MPSKPRSTAREPVEAVQPSGTQGLPPPSTEGVHKEVEACWAKLIESLEAFLEEEPEGPRRENILACLRFAQEHGYPEDPYCLWAVDGVARCMEGDEFIKIAHSSENRAQLPHTFSCVRKKSIYVF